MSKPTVAFAHLGCEKNRVDTEHMLGLLAEAGYGVSADESEASVVVVNTCSFIQDAREESVRTLVELAEQGKELIIAGCLAQHFQEELLESLPEARAIVGTGDYQHIVSVLERVEAGERVNQVSANPTFVGDEHLPRYRTTSEAVAYLKVAEGCDYRCAFCILSAALSLGLFLLSLKQGEWPDRGQLVFRCVLVALVVALGALGWAAAADRPAVLSSRGAPIPVTSVSNPSTLALAERLTETGAVMYSAYWCPHCNEQKQLFGKEAAARLKVVECAVDGQNSQAELCNQKKIEGYPTWEIKGQLDSGVKPLQKLAELSGYGGTVTNATPRP